MMKEDVFPPQGIKEFKIAKGWRIFVDVTLGAAIVALCWGYYKLCRDMQEPLGTRDWLVLLGAPVLIGLMILVLMDTHKRRLIITSHRLISISLFTRRELDLNEIKGYRETENYFLVEPNSTSKKSIKLHRYLQQQAFIHHWLINRFPDLDEQEAADEAHAILANEALGFTVEQRAEKINEAKRIAQLVNGLGILASLWAFLYPLPYVFAFSLAIAVIPISLVAVSMVKGLIGFNDDKRRAYPSILSGLTMCCAAVALRGMLDYNLSEHSVILIMSAACAAFFLIIILLHQQEWTFRRGADYFNVLAIGALLTGYSYGSLCYINCQFDQQPSVSYTTKVLSKQMRGGKTKTPRITIESWDTPGEEKEIRVAKDFYKKINPGDTITISIHEGTLDIPWIEV